MSEHPAPSQGVTITLDDVRRALTLPGFDPVAAQMRVSRHPQPLRQPGLPGSPKLAGVLVLIYPCSIAATQGAADALFFVLIRRTEYPGVHSGQIGLPGGRCEPEEPFGTAALRETFEEVGVRPEAIDLIGTLAPLYVPPSDFEIHPYVGFTPQHPDWVPDATEVAEILEVRLSVLLDDSIKRLATIEREGQQFNIAYYDIAAHRVWGATAAILAEFESRLRVALGLPDPQWPHHSVQ